jgi:hypothetical protein
MSLSRAKAREIGKERMKKTVNKYQARNARAQVRFKKKRAALARYMKHLN